MVCNISKWIYWRSHISQIMNFRYNTIILGLMYFFSFDK
jgi:hypothetical protein